MKLSARNILKGKIVDVVKGQTTAHVRIDIGGAAHRENLVWSMFTGYKRS